MRASGDNTCRTDKVQRRGNLLKDSLLSAPCQTTRCPPARYMRTADAQADLRDPADLIHDEEHPKRATAVGPGRWHTWDAGNDTAPSPRELGGKTDDFME